jgi:hypothetical protein
MGGAIYPLPQYAFMAWCSVKTQRQLYLTFTLIRLFNPALETVLHNWKWERNISIKLTKS